MHKLYRETHLKIFMYFCTDNVAYFTVQSVADPGFLSRGGNPWIWAEKLLFGKIFAKNCTKMKEIGPRGGTHPPMVIMVMPAWFVTVLEQ